uniref:Uncharacterized protein n=1 Tax=Salvator merianae TaxID=96440 RepID=A0A8D0DSK3_SALMN
MFLLAPIKDTAVVCHCLLPGRGWGLNLRPSAFQAICSTTELQPLSHYYFSLPLVCRMHNRAVIKNNNTSLLPGSCKLNFRVTKRRKRFSHGEDFQ